VFTAVFCRYSQTKPLPRTWLVLIGQGSGDGQGF
jgi:hypothetical protein